MSNELPRVEDGLFVWECRNGHQMNARLDVLAVSAVENETTIVGCGYAHCDDEIELPDEFQNNLRTAIKRVNDDDE